MDLAERLSALQEKNNQQHGLNDEEAKVEFLQRVSEGTPINRAAREAGRTATWFKRRRNPDAVNYDEEFTAAFEAITAPGGEYEYSIVESTFAAMVKSGEDGNVRAQEKVLAALSPRFAFLRPQTFSGAINVETLVQILPGVSNETLERMISEAEAQKALPEGVSRVIDAE